MYSCSVVAIALALIELVLLNIELTDSQLTERVRLSRSFKQYPSICDNNRENVQVVDDKEK